MSAPPAITVVGGGIAGLVAAVSCAEAGFPVRLHEARRRLGGRARSMDGEWTANFGPHALCSARANWSWLNARGLLPRTAWISPPGSRFRHRGRVSRTPPSSVLAGLGAVRRPAPVDASFADWARSELGAAAALALSRLAAASFTFHNDPGELSARFVWDRVRWMFVPPAVHRVVGGWSALVDRLARQARELSVEIECGRALEALPSPPVILAVELPDAAKLLGKDLWWQSGGCVALDVGIEHRRGDPPTILDLDHGVLVQAQYPSAAPEGHRLYQAHAGVRPGEPPDDGLGRIEEVLDHAFSRWRERLAWRRQMTVTGRTGALDYPGTTWRDRPSIEQGDGVFLAGDMVAADGLLSEVSFNSALEASRLAIAWCSRHAGTGAGPPTASRKIAGTPRAVP